jgi:hypothetical protein
MSRGERLALDRREVLRLRFARAKNARNFAQDDGTTEGANREIGVPRNGKSVPADARRLADWEPSMFAGHSMLCPYEENGEEPKRES